MVTCVIGEVLWDIFPDGERFGGAALNFCANLQRLGEQAILLSAVGDDLHGHMALEQMRILGIGTQGVRVVNSLPTGTARVSMNEAGEPSFVIPRPAAFDEVSVDAAMLTTLKAQGVAWVYFGTLLQTNPAVEQLTQALQQALYPVRGFYDVNLRTGQWNLALIRRLSRLASMMKLNEIEAQTLFSLTNPAEEVFSLERFCTDWAANHGIEVICITLGPAGCLIYAEGAFHRVAGYPVTVCDTVGSGDAFAAAFLHGYERGWSIPDTARFANALGALVASLAGATPSWTLAEVKSMLEEQDADVSSFEQSWK